MKTFLSIIALLFSVISFAQQLPDQLSLELRASESKFAEYLFTRNAFIEMPAELETTSQASVTIYYNYLNPSQYEFQCTYASSASTRTSDFVNCMTSEGQVIMDEPSDLELLQFPMDKNSKIVMVLTGPESDRTIIRSSFKVIWK